MRNGTIITTTELKRYYYNPQFTRVDVARRLGVAASSLDILARKHGLLTRDELRRRGIEFSVEEPEPRLLSPRRRYYNCHTCIHNSMAWCRANPHADRLPCEREATPYVERESSYYHSPDLGAVMGVGE